MDLNTTWQDTATALGTIAVAVVAVGVALYAEWRADIRIKRERAHSANVLAEERAAADARLLRQIEHSDIQLRQERRRAQEAAQEAEAWAIEVIPNLTLRTNDGTKALYVTVQNFGEHTITQVDAQFSPDGKTVIPKHKFERLDEYDSSNPSLMLGRVSDFTNSGYHGILTRGAAIRFWSDQIAESHLAGPFPLVRWKDYMGQLWEHRLGRVRRITENEPWSTAGHELPSG